MRQLLQHRLKSNLVGGTGSVQPRGNYVKRMTEGQLTGNILEALGGYASGAFNEPIAEILVNGTYDADLSNWLFANPGTGNYSWDANAGNGRLARSPGPPGGDFMYQNRTLEVGRYNYTSLVNTISGSPRYLVNSTNDFVSLLGDDYTFSVPVKSNERYGCGTDGAEFNLDDFSLVRVPAPSIFFNTPVYWDAPNEGFSGITIVNQTKTSNAIITEVVEGSGDGQTLSFVATWDNGEPDYTTDVLLVSYDAGALNANLRNSNGNLLASFTDLELLAL